MAYHVIANCRGKPLCGSLLPDLRVAQVGWIILFIPFVVRLILGHVLHIGLRIWIDPGEKTKERREL
jgi:hypothetical protein